MKKLDSAAVSVLNLEDFARLLSISVDDIPEDCRRIIKIKDFRYQILDKTARDRVITNILKRIDSADLWVSGSDKKEIWERGWLENLQDYLKTGDISALTPKFVQREPILRLDGDYVQPLDSNFEFNFVDVYRRCLFRKYFKDVQAIYEFGCGSCQHLALLAEIFPDKNLHGLDWSEVSVKIIERMVKNKGWNITGHVFNLFSPEKNLNLDRNCGVFTVGTMEQLGRNFEPFLQFILIKQPAIVVHIETTAELYDDNRLSDYLAIRYDRKRGYLDGYLNRLRQLESENRISILKVQRILFGSMYHDGYSLIVWKPI